MPYTEFHSSTFISCPSSFPLRPRPLSLFLSVSLSLRLSLSFLPLPRLDSSSTLIIAAYVLLCIPISAKYMALIMHELCRAAAEEVAEGSTRWFGVFSFGDTALTSLTKRLSLPPLSLGLHLCLSLSFFIYHLNIVEISCSRIFFHLSFCLYPLHSTYIHIHIHPIMLSFFHSSTFLLLFLRRLKAVDQRRNVYRRYEVLRSI